MDNAMEKAHPSFYEKKRGNILRFINECVSDQIDTSNRDSETAMAILMDHYLEASIVAERRVARELTSVLMHVYREVGSQAGRSIKKYLLDPGTSIEVLREIKEHHQRVARTARSEAERRIATAVYFGAIASALVFHRQKMTSYSFDKLKQAIHKLLDTPWIDPELKGLLEQASKALNERTHTTHGHPQMDTDT